MTAVNLVLHVRLTWPKFLVGSLTIELTRTSGMTDMFVMFPHGGTMALAIQYGLLGAGIALVSLTAARA